MNNNTNLRENIGNWLKKNSQEINYNTSNIDSIIQLIENYISDEDKTHNDLWLEYFMYMNFLNARIKIIKDTWDKNFIKDKLKLIDLKVFENLYFNSILECAKRGVFEKNVIFDENNFYLGVDRLDKDISECIRSVLDKLYEKK